MSNFWKANYSVDQTNKFDDLLAQDTCTLESLLDILQEVKAQNKSLISFLSSRASLLKMIRYTLGSLNQEIDEKAQVRYPYVSCEIFCCDQEELYEGILGDPSLIETIFSFLDGESPLPQPSVNYFARVVHILLLKRREEMYEYLQDKFDIIDKMINHIGSFPIFEVLMFIIRTEAEIELNNPEEVITWLTTVNFVQMFVKQLTPDHSLEARENATSALSDIVNDVIPSFFAIEEESQDTEFDPTEPVVPKIRPFALFPFIFGPNPSQPLTILRHVCDKQLSSQLLKTIISIPRDSPIILDLFTLITDLLKMVTSPTFIESPQSFLPGIVFACIENLDYFASILSDSPPASPGLQYISDQLGKPLSSKPNAEVKSATDVSDASDASDAPADDTTDAPADAAATDATTDAEKPTETKTETEGSPDPATPTTTTSTSSISKNQTISIKTTCSTVTPPLGQIRLSIVKLIHGLLSTNYRCVEEAIAKTNIIELILNFFFDYPFNNILHSAVTDVLRSIFHHEVLFCDALDQFATSPIGKTPSEKQDSPDSTSAQNGGETPSNGAIKAPENDLRSVKSQPPPPLSRLLFEKYKLHTRLVKVTADSQEIVKDGGFALGILVHVTIISNHLTELTEISPKLTQTFINDPLWKSFTSDTLDSINAIEKQYLGGEMPTVDPVMDLSDDDNSDDDDDDDDDGEYEQSNTSAGWGY